MGGVRGGAVACGVGGALVCAALVYRLVLAPRWASKAPVRRVACGPGAARVRVESGGAGGATTVLIHGMGCNTLEWCLLVPHLQGRWVAYDRTVSVDGDLRRPRSAEVLLEELRAVLRESGVQPPYVLVGHSYGGQIARCYALRYRAEVRALLMIDPAHELQFSPPMPLDFQLAFAALPAVCAVYSLLAPFGLARLQDSVGGLLEPHVTGLSLAFPPLHLYPRAARVAARELYSHAAPWRLLAAELAGFKASYAWVASLGELDAALPVTIIVAAKRNLSPSLFPDSITAAFVALAERVLRDSPLHRVVLAPASDHWVHLQQPELVLAELARLMREVSSMKT
jgi:pimeloyl-ACP methyl ester carboxylesterase